MRTVVVSAFVASGIAAAMPASAGTETTVAPAVWSNCKYRVGVATAVRKTPSPTGTVLKTKAAGTTVTSPTCLSTGAGDGEFYIHVACSCAASGTGYMRDKYLTLISHS